MHLTHRELPDSFILDSEDPDRAQGTSNFGVPLSELELSCVRTSEFPLGACRPQSELLLDFLQLRVSFWIEAMNVLHSQ